MRTPTIIGLMAALFLAACTGANNRQGATQETLITSTATVESIDQTTREVRLRDDKDGAVFLVTAGPEVQNLAQVSAGDRVTVDFYQSVTASMADPADSGEAATAIVAGRAPEGAMPGALAVQSDSMVVTVVSYDRNTGLATYRTPDGLDPPLGGAAEPARLRRRPRPRRPRPRHHDQSRRRLRHPGGLTGQLGAPRSRSTTRPSRAAGRITSIRGASNPSRTGPPSGRVRGPDPPVRPEGTRRPASAAPPTPAPRPAPIGKSDTRVPAASVDLEPRRAEKAEILPPDQHHPLGWMLRQRVHRGQVVVDPPAEKAQPDEKRRLDRVEALLEVGRSPARPPRRPPPRPPAAAPRSGANPCPR